MGVVLKHTSLALLQTHVRFSLPNGTNFAPGETLLQQQGFPKDPQRVECRFMDALHKQWRPCEGLRLISACTCTLRSACISHCSLPRKLHPNLLTFATTVWAPVGTTSTQRTTVLVLVYTQLEYLHCLLFIVSRNRLPTASTVLTVSSKTHCKPSHYRLELLVL